MDRVCSPPRFVGILLVFVLVFVSNTFANNLTLVSNNSSTNTVSTNSTVIDFSPKNNTTNLNNTSTSVLPPDNRSTSDLPSLSTSDLPSLSTSNVPSLNNTSSNVSSPFSKNTSSTKISNRFDELSENSTTNKTLDSNGTIAYINVEAKLPTLSYDEIFKFKRKCCPFNKVFVGLFDHCFTAICEDIPKDASTVFSFERHPDTAHLKGDALQNDEPFHCDGPPQYGPPYENVTVLPNGSMYFFEKGVTRPFPDDEKFVYCLEPISDDNLLLFSCEMESDPQPLAYKITKIVSCVFLTGFIVVYMLKPKLHTLHNRCLMRLIICLLGRCVLSIVFHMKLSTCARRKFFIQYATAAGAYFFFMASFCWTTVICYDVWSGIRMKSTKNVQRVSVQRKIRKYSQYGWGLASVILIIAVFIDFLAAGADDDSWVSHVIIAPQFALYEQRWMGTNKAMYIYFYGPLLTLNVINLVFFVLTLNTIIQVRKDNNNVFKRSDCSRRHVQAEIKWFSIFAKLYVVMGITWVLDIFAFELSDSNSQKQLLSKIVVYSVDIFNLSQGILIFFITIFNKETARTLSKTFSATIMKARGSLTNSKKGIVTDDTTLQNGGEKDGRERASSKERSTSV